MKQNYIEIIAITLTTISIVTFIVIVTTIITESGTVKLNLAEWSCTKGKPNLEPNKKPDWQCEQWTQRQD